MNAKEIQDRTKGLALRVMKLVDALPRGRSADVVANQLVRCATSVGANYRAVCRARSTAEFISKMSIVVEEADETLYWLELISESGLLPPPKVQGLMDEAKEFVAIFATSRATAKKNQQLNK